MKITKASFSRVALEPASGGPRPRDTVRAHNFITQLFARIFGGGVVKIQDDHGKQHYLNKNSLRKWYTSCSIINSQGMTDDQLVNAVKDVVENKRYWAIGEYVSSDRSACVRSQGRACDVEASLERYKNADRLGNED